MIFNLTSIPATVWASGDVPGYRFTQGGSFLRLDAFKAPDPDRPRGPWVWFWWMTRAHMGPQGEVGDTQLVVIPPSALTPVSGPLVHFAATISETQQIFGRAEDFQRVATGSHLKVSAEWMQIAKTCVICAPPLRTRETLYASPRHAGYPIWSRTASRWIDPVQRWDRP